MSLVKYARMTLVAGHAASPAQAAAHECELRPIYSGGALPAASPWGQQQGSGWQPSPTQGANSGQCYTLSYGNVRLLSGPPGYSMPVCP